MAGADVTVMLQYDPHPAVGAGPAAPTPTVAAPTGPTPAPPVSTASPVSPAPADPSPVPGPPAGRPTPAVPVASVPAPNPTHPTVPVLPFTGLDAFVFLAVALLACVAGSVLRLTSHDTGAAALRPLPVTKE